MCKNTGNTQSFLFLNVLLPLSIAIDENQWATTLTKRNAYIMLQKQKLLSFVFTGARDSN
jgi:hypothetical protein